METGINAWVANHEFDFSDSNARIDLPGGWHWDISPAGTGYLKSPANELCVGYDLNNSTIRFGANGETKAPGLNLWIIQEMGEKFARENFMDVKTRSAYDEFIKVRGIKRKEYEKEIRAEMAGIIQLEVKEGTWIAHVDTEAVKAMTGIESEAELTAEKGVALFNKMSEVKHVMPLRDPLGYMVLDDNLYDYIKDQYEFQYDDTIQNIDSGFINGNGRGCEAILEKLDATVRKNVREHCLPEGINYQDLRYVSATPELQTAVNNFVKCRVTITIDYEKKRDHSKESLERDREKYLEAGAALKSQIANTVFPSLDVSLNGNNDMKIE